MEFVITGLDRLPAAANELLKAHPEARLFAFSGKMGVGKTTFIKALCSELGVKGFTGSPSFTIINVYDSPVAGEIFHFDFYRIKDIREVYDLGYEEYFYSGNYCFMEWPEKSQELLPSDTIRLVMEEDEKTGFRVIRTL